MTVGGVGQDKQHVLAGLGICDGGGGVVTGAGGGGVAAGSGAAGVEVGGLQPLGTIHINFYALFSCICTVVFGRFLKDVGGGKNVRKE